MPAEPLAQAAKARHRHAIERAQGALRDLDREDAAINFQAVARRAGVSRQWLYTQPVLRGEIERLRNGAPIRADSVPARQRTTEASLRQRLKTLRADTSGYARRTTASRPNSPTPTAVSAAARPLSG